MFAGNRNGMSWGGRTRADPKDFALKPRDPLLGPEGQTLLGGGRADPEGTCCPWLKTMGLPSTDQRSTDGPRTAWTEAQPDPVRDPSHRTAPQPGPLLPPLWPPALLGAGQT